MPPTSKQMPSPLLKRFESEDSAWFSALSGDMNPLHHDETYARLTPWGKPVLHGMAGVFAALGAWRSLLAPEEGSIALHSLKVQFRKPIFCGQELELRISTISNQEVTLAWVRGESVYVKIEIVVSGSAPSWRSSPVPSLFPRIAARTAAESLPWEMDSQLSNFAYSMDERILRDLRSPVGDHAVAARQLQVLAWASYFVGMEWPGASALFLECSFEFSAFSRTSSSDPLSLDTLKSKFDSRFRTWTFKGESKDALFQIRSVDRPEPVLYSSELLTQSLPEKSPFSGKTLLITGGSRGFGSLLCEGFSQLGASVWYTSRSALTEDTRSPLQQVGVKPLTGDMSDRSSCLAISELLLESGVELDGVILNASPSITAYEWLEQRDEEALAFIEKTAAMVLYPLRALLPRLRKAGFVIYISSEYVKKPVRHFAHYIAAKSAAEGLIRSLAAEFPIHSFIIVRPPRMLTNQTNLAFDSTPPAKTELVVGELLTTLCHQEFAKRLPGLSELDLSSPDPLE